MKRESDPTKYRIILDIHTHRAAPQPEGIISLRLREDSDLTIIDENQLYSVGIHPWDTLQNPTPAEFSQLEKLAELPQTAAIGEAGIDLLSHREALYKQLQIFKRHIEISERLHKPLVIHDVKAHDIILGAQRDLKPKQNWVIHGFRGKAGVAEMLLKAGLYLSFGAEFNAETLKRMPAEKILAETDESESDIYEIINKISQVRDEDMTGLIASNTRRFLNNERD